MRRRHLTAGIMTLAACLMPLRPGQAQTTAGLAAWWSFDQGGGVVISDDSGHGNQGLLIGHFGWRSGRQASALEFRARDYLDGGALPGFNTQQMTLAAFLWVDHADANMWIAAKGLASQSFWGLQVLDDGRLRFSAFWRDSFTREGHWESTRRVTPHQWTHVAVSYDGARLVFYIDGQGESVNAQFGFNLGSVLDEPLLLGADDTREGDYFDGLMDELRLYNRALSADEIRGLIVSDNRAEQPTPAHEARGVQTPQLRWQAATGAVSQRVFLGGDADRLAWVADRGAGNSSYRYAPGFTPGQTYHWRIDSIGADGRISPGDLWSFTALGLQAEGPDPAHGAKYVPVQLQLTWTPGVQSSNAQHVYFGTDHQAVANADETWPQYRGQVSAFERFFDPGQLIAGTTYFWRVDSVGFDDTRFKGDVWHFSTRSATSALDSDLNLWWKLDEGAGDMALDSSGYKNDGKIHQGSWVEARWGQGIEFDSRSSYIVHSDAGAAGLQRSDVTLSAWVYPYSQSHERVIAWWNARGIWLAHERLVVTWDGQDRSVVTGDITDEWTHVALTARSNSQRTAYVNGQQRPLIPGAIRFSTAVSQPGFTLGNTEPAWGRHFFDGIIDDVRVYSRVLAAGEIAELFMGGAGQASQPDPAHTEEIDPSLVRQLAWQGDLLTQGFDVYLGEDKQAVDTAVSSSPDVYLGQYHNPWANLPTYLRAGNTYYWRVDAVQNSTSIMRGPIWQFTTARTWVIDDFEDYSAAPSMRIYETWIDGGGFGDVSGNGTGSTVGHLPPPFYEMDIVHGGDKSMPLDYNNVDGPFFSETNRSFSTPQDWLGSGMKSLVLHYWGDPTNSLGPQDRLYLAIRDTQGRDVVLVCHHRPSLLQRARWHQWKIGWEQFNPAHINLRGITQFSIGIGNRAHPQAGEKGVIMIDDLGLSSLGH